MVGFGGRVAPARSARGVAGSRSGFDGAPKYYREELCALTLDVDAHRALFLAAGNALHATYMNVKIETWERQLEGPYRFLEDTFNRWLGEARAAIGRWIREDGNADAAEIAGTAMPR